MSKLFFLLALVFAVSGSSLAQDKIGYFSSSELVGMIPEAQNVLKEIETITLQKQSDGEALEKELQSKYASFEKEKEAMAEIVRNSKIEEIQRLDAKIKAYYKSAKEEIAKLRTEKLKPVIEKVNAAIKKVAKQHKYTFIIDTDTGGQFLLFVDESRNLLPLMKKELGIK